MRVLHEKNGSYKLQILDAETEGNGERTIYIPVILIVAVTFNRNLNFTGPMGDFLCCRPIFGMPDVAVGRKGLILM